MVSPTWPGLLTVPHFSCMWNLEICDTREVPKLIFITPLVSAKTSLCTSAFHPFLYWYLILRLANTCCLLPSHPYSCIVTSLSSLSFHYLWVTSSYLGVSAQVWWVILPGFVGHTLVCWDMPGHNQCNEHDIMTKRLSVLSALYNPKFGWFNHWSQPECSGKERVTTQHFSCCLDQGILSYGYSNIHSNLVCNVLWWKFNPC